jgi:hypothetical protein
MHASGEGEHLVVGLGAGARAVIGELLARRLPVRGGASYSPSNPAPRPTSACSTATTASSQWARGYLPVLLRDCTVGIETRDTLEGLLSTCLAVQHVERRYHGADSASLLAACRAITLKTRPSSAPSPPARGW